MNDFTKIQDFKLIDFGSVEHTSDFNPDIDYSKIELPSKLYKDVLKFSISLYKDVKDKILRYEGTNDFGCWFCLNLEMNNYLLYRRLLPEQCLSLSYYLKRLEESNEELKETLRTWREDESKLSPHYQVMVHNVLTAYYVVFLDSYTLSYYDEDCFSPSGRLNEFITKYHPRLLKKSSDFGRIRSDFGRIRKENYNEFIAELEKRTMFEEFDELFGGECICYEWDVNVFNFHVNVGEEGLLQYFFSE